MTSLHWEMSVLSRSVAYPNLSAAALHVGLSQPQLSRIVRRLEVEFHLSLLDRAARRKSSWTRAAFRLSEVYANSERKLENEIHKLVKAAEPTQVRMGTLEGLSAVASECCERLLRSTPVELVQLDVHELNVLEELFLSNELDLILTSRAPGRKKFKFVREMGYQTLDQVSGKIPKNGAAISVYSGFEYGARALEGKAGAGKRFVSNSLELRKAWIHGHGGTGTIPSELRRQRPPQGVSVLLFGAEALSETLWSVI